MAEKTTKTGRALERQVADAYRAIGARKVEHDVELAGHQIDVYVEMETADRSLHRIAVEAKDYTEPVGIKIVADYAAVVDGLRPLKWVDEGVIVSTAGFSKQGRNAAKEHGLRLLEPADLEAMVGGPDLAQMLTDYLAHAVAAYEARMYQLVARPAAPPDQPYKFLYAFEIEDADIFFGRDAAGEDLHKTILRDRLTVLHAKSGAGKTSLVNAGLSPRLIRKGRLPVYARAYEDPVRAIKRAIAPPSLGPWPELLDKLTLHEFLGLTCARLSRQTQELVIILDQFEEFFIFWPELDHRQPLIDALADCYDDRSLPVRFVIALRKDYYSDLADFQGRIPTILYNEYRLDTMTRQEAQAAITGPVAKLGRPVTYKQALLDALLVDLARGGMELPHLQIICTRLYEALDEEQTALTLASYEKLARAEGVLGGYLNDVLDKLGGREVIARNVLKEMVSSEATKRVLGYDTLAARVEAEREELDEVLAWLVNARLLRREKVVGEITYEMAHEYLIERVEKWIDREDLAFKQAEELLAREVANRRVHGTLIPRDRLELLYAQREQFRGWDDETWDCILRSALQADFAVEDWVKLAGEHGEEFLLVLLGDPCEEMRRAAIRSLGSIWGLPGVSRMWDENLDWGERLRIARDLLELDDPRVVDLFVVALQDDDWDVRWIAVDVLGTTGDPRAVELLIDALWDEDWQVRARAAEGLGQMRNLRAVESLIATLRDADSDVRRVAAVALGQLGDRRAVEPIIATLRDEDSEVRTAGVTVLGDLGDSRVVELLITVLHDEDSEVRAAAALTLGGFGDPRAVEPLVAALHDGGSEVRAAAATALGGFGDPYAMEPLIAALRDGISEVCASAARALGYLGDPRAVVPLITALQDEDSDVRESAAWALGELGDPRAVKPLIATLGDERWNVCGAATEALKRIGTPEALAVLEK